MDNGITMDAMVVATEQQVSSALGDETVILHMTDGFYFSLGQVGTSIWGLLREPRTVREIRDRLVDEYDVKPERCERELNALLHELLAHGLLCVSVAEAAAR